MFCSVGSVLDYGKCFGLWEMFCSVGSVLDSENCFVVWEVFCCVESVLLCGKCFQFCEVFSDSGKCFWILGSVFGFWEVFWILVFCPYGPPNLVIGLLKKACIRYVGLANTRDT